MRFKSWKAYVTGEGLRIRVIEAVNFARILFFQTMRNLHVWHAGSRSIFRSTLKVRKFEGSKVTSAGLPRGGTRNPQKIRTPIVILNENCLNAGRGLKIPIFAGYLYGCPHKFFTPRS